MEPFVPQRIKKKKGEKGFSKDANVLQRENLLEVDKGSNSSLYGERVRRAIYKWVDAHRVK